jgi:hypothetical protein
MVVNRSGEWRMGTLASWSLMAERETISRQRYLHATGERRHMIADTYETTANDMQIGPSYLKVGT